MTSFLWPDKLGEIVHGTNFLYPLLFRSIAYIEGIYARYAYAGIRISADALVVGPSGLCS